MTEEEIVECFDKYSEEFFDFEWNPSLPSKRADICAFIFLDKLFPDGKSDMIAGAEHDEIYLDVDVSLLAQTNITEENIKFLVSCGVYINSDGHLYMFA